MYSCVGRNRFVSVSPTENICTVRNVYAKLNPGGPCRIGPSASPSNHNDSGILSVGKTFCSDGS